MQYFLVYLAVINVIGFAIMGIDKQKAKRGRFRISEKTLFFVAFLGGSVGAKIGMELFRHKTHHKKFIYGIPAVIVIQLVAFIYFLYRY
jgi:uncharacterized membrane protein YsdA (DUF1294 family)